MVADGKPYYVTEDGVTVKEGERAFNYYDMKPGVIGEPSIPFDGWFRFMQEGGSALLNGARICSVAHAEKMGWM